jgi:hypothetical protein
MKKSLVEFEECERVNKQQASKRRLKKLVNLLNYQTKISRESARELEQAKKNQWEVMSVFLSFFNSNQINEIFLST